MKTVVSAANTTVPNVVPTVVNSTPSNETVANNNNNNSAILKDEPIGSSSDNVTFSAPTGLAPNSSSSSLGDNAAKRPASLDLNKSAKKPRLLGASPLIIDSPDLASIKALNTPDLEKILLNSNLLQTPQPGLVFPTKVGPVTSEQEAFGKGFEEALHSLHNKQNLQVNPNTNQNNNNNNNNNNNANNNNNVATTVETSSVAITSTTAGTGMSGGSFTYTTLGDTALPVAIKDEPQNGPASPPVSPIDMETQEKIKLERKRQRNRVAASKCRKRKLERISKLEDKVKCLKGENTDLGLVVKTLKDHVAQLKQQVIEHIQSGCSIPSVQYNGSTSSK